MHLLHGILRAVIRLLLTSKRKGEEATSNTKVKVGEWIVVLSIPQLRTLNEWKCELRVLHYGALIL